MGLSKYMFINKSNTMIKVLLGGSLLVIVAIALYAFVVPKPAIPYRKSGNSDLRNAHQMVHLGGSPRSQ